MEIEIFGFKPKRKLIFFPSLYGNNVIAARLNHAYDGIAVQAKTPVIALEIDNLEEKSLTFQSKAFFVFISIL